MSLDNFVKSLSKPALATMVISIGIVLIVVMDPPRSVCSAQVDSFLQKNEEWLVKGETKSSSRPRWTVAQETCLKTNSPGGCYQLFQYGRRLISEVDVVNNECRSQLWSEGTVKNFISSLGVLIAQVGWGDKPPASSQERFSWLDAADRDLFCEMLERVKTLGGANAPTEIFESARSKFPGVEGMGRDEVWAKSIFSSCRL
jgi:hypothetical protein